MLSTTFEKSMGLLGLMSDCVRYLTKGIVCYHLIKYGDLVVSECDTCL